MEINVKQLKKAVNGLDFDADKLERDGHIGLMLQKANKDKSLAFLERYLAKLAEYQRDKPKAEEEKKS